MVRLFLKAHWRTIVAADFSAAEVWSLRGLLTYYIFFVIELARRIVHIAGITAHPDEAWMLQVARNLTDVDHGALNGKSHLIIDRDTKYTAQFRRLIAESKTAAIRLPPRSPNLNAYAERYVRSVREECLDRMIFIGEGSLRRALREFDSHYHLERNHQGIGNRLIQAQPAAAGPTAEVRRRQRLGGMHSFYFAAAARSARLSNRTIRARRSIWTLRGDVAVALRQKVVHERRFAAADIDNRG
jgi:hypothetical protein